MRCRTVAFNPYSSGGRKSPSTVCVAVRRSGVAIGFGEVGRQIEPFRVIRTGNEVRPVSRWSVGAAARRIMCFCNMRI